MPDDRRLEELLLEELRELRAELRLIAPELRRAIRDVDVRREVRERSARITASANRAARRRFV